MTTAQPWAATRELHEEIDSALRHNAGLAGLVDAAHRVRERPDLLRGRLRYLLAHPEMLAAVAARSYWHVNGFAKIRLLERDDYCARLHVWPAGDQRRGDEEPHSHRWDFASWVAVGGGLVERYWLLTGEDDPRGTPHFEYRYERRADAGLVRAQRITLLRPDERWQRTGRTVYGCPYEVVHTVAPVGSNLLATVVLQGRARSDSTMVYRPAGRLCTTRQGIITPEELVGLFGAVDAAVATSGAN